MTPPQNSTPTSDSAATQQSYSAILSTFGHNRDELGDVFLLEIRTPPPHHPKGRFGTILRYKNLPKFLVIGLLPYFFSKKLPTAKIHPWGSRRLPTAQNSPLGKNCRPTAQNSPLGKISITRFVSLKYFFPLSQLV